MTKGKMKSKRLVMSEPSYKKRKVVSAEISATAVKKSPPSKTASKRKSLTGRDILKLRKLKQKQKDDVPRILFPSDEEKKVPAKASLKQSSSKVVKGDTPGKVSSRSLASSPDVVVSKSTGETFDDSLNSTLPFEESNSADVEGDMLETEDDIISFLRTPAANGKNDREEDMDKTPLFTKKTPMPEGNEQWLYSSKKKKRKGFGGKYILKCDNLPKGTTPQYLGLFFAESDLFPKMRFKQALRAGRGRKRVSKYAILYCKTAEERDKLLGFDEITMPSVTNSKDRVLRIVPMLTKRETKSTRALRISNLAEGTTEQDLRDFFEKKDISIYKIYLYPNDRCAIVLFRSADATKKALHYKGSKLLKGSEMEFHRNHGQMKYGERGELLNMDESNEERD